MRIERRYLRYLAAALWLTVGLGLTVRGILWWQETLNFFSIGLYTLFILPLAYLFSSRILTRISKRNLRHIRSLPEKTCIFAFQPARSYFIMFGMIALGVALRHSPLPRSHLGGLYIFMGLSLALASLNFLRYS